MMDSSPWSTASWSTSARGRLATPSITFDFQPQLFKVPRLCNLYQKIGMFGMAASGSAFSPATTTTREIRSAASGSSMMVASTPCSASCVAWASRPFLGFTIPEGTFPDNPHGLEDIRRAISSAATSSRSCSRSTAT